MSQQTDFALTGKRLRILVLCGDDAPSTAIANVYAAAFKDHEVCFVTEKVLTLQRFLLFSRRRLQRSGVVSLLGSYLYYGVKLVQDLCTERRRYTPCMTSKNISTDKKVAARVRAFGPDVVLVGFCGLLAPSFLEILKPAKVYNTHPGINPRYRGFGNIWAFSEQNPACTGFTLHEVDEGADTGPVLTAQPVDFSGIPFSQIDVHAGRMAAQLLANFVLGQSLPNTPPQFTGLASRYYGVPTIGTYFRGRKNYKNQCVPISARHVLITGASGGIGASLAEAYAAPCTHLTLWARDRERLEAIAGKCREKGAEVTITSLDYRDFGTCRQEMAAIDSARPIDLLVLNAGVSTGTLPDGSPEAPADLCRSLDVNLTGTLNLASIILERMKLRGQGHLVFMSSIAALYPLPDSPVYGAGKAALAYYAKAMRGFYSGSGLQISTVYPGYVDSPMSRRLHGPQPLRWDSARAATHIKKALDRQEKTIIFPKILALGSLLLHLLPFPVALFFLNKFGFVILPDQEAAPQKGKTQ